MKWLVVIMLFLGAAMFLWIYIDKYKFFKKNGYWYMDSVGGKHGALIFSIMSFLAGIFCLIIAIRDYFV